MLAVALKLRADDDSSAVKELRSYDECQAGFFNRSANPLHERALRQAIDDLRMLLPTTPHGLYPAAGMPCFVNVFGRDALITAMMLLDAQPDVLRLLAAEQALAVDPFREEEPGKILHEMRRGELSRTSRIRFERVLWFGRFHHLVRDGDRGHFEHRRRPRAGYRIAHRRRSPKYRAFLTPLFAPQGHSTASLEIMTGHASSRLVRRGRPTNSSPLLDRIAVTLCGGDRRRRRLFTARALSSDPGHPVGERDRASGAHPAVGRDLDV